MVSEQDLKSFIYDNASHTEEFKVAQVNAGMLFKCPYCDFEVLSNFFLVMDAWEIDIMEHMIKKHTDILEEEFGMSGD